MIDLYVDGGEMISNPSKIGGTWAWAQVIDDVMVEYGSGRFTPEDIDMPQVTNNLAELYAALEGMANMPDGWKGTIYTDSQTTYYRICLDGSNSPSMKGIPRWLQDELSKQQKRLGRYSVVMIGGHPTKAELAEGCKENGVLVSRHNHYCDTLCKRESKAFMANPDNFPAMVG